MGIYFSSARAQEIEDAIMASKLINEGVINLNSSEPAVTDVCWLDISLGGSLAASLWVVAYDRLIIIQWLTRWQHG